MGVFRRSLPSPLTLALTSVPTDTSGFRPGKIGDLEITLLREKQQLLASWTAPGGDYSDGQVKTYRFVYSQKIEELLSTSVNALALVGFKRKTRQAKGSVMSSTSSTTARTTMLASLPLTSLDTGET